MMKCEDILTKVIYTPAGAIVLGSIDDDSLCLCDWLCRKESNVFLARLAARYGRRLRGINSPITDRPEKQLAERSSFIIDNAEKQLEEYFSGTRRDFDIPLALNGTIFQIEVWEALKGIPYGETKTYHEIAETIGRPKAVRAVASAIGANPLSIFLPCHRVIGSDGTLTGYAGGLPAKRILLTLESSLPI